MRQDLTEAQHAALQQFMALKVLTNSTLMYSSCVGVLLKRDTDMPGRMGASPRARDGKPGKLFRCVLGLLGLGVPFRLPLVGHQSCLVREGDFIVCLQMSLSQQGARAGVGCMSRSDLP